MSKDNIIDINKIKEDKNNMEIFIYGKPFVESSIDFLNREYDYYNVFLQHIDGTETLNDDQLNEVRKQLFATIQTLTRQAYLDGCLYGHNYKEDIYNTNEIVFDKNFMIIYDFHDNDYGQLIEDAAEYWCNLWNACVHSLIRYKQLDSDYSYNSTIEKLNNLEKIKVISRIIANGFCSSNIMSQNEYDRYCDKDVPTPEILLNDCTKSIKYLGILNEDNYYKGNIKDIEKYTIDTYKDMQDNGDKTPFNNLWLNGECLFIKVEHGYATTFVK